MRVLHDWDRLWRSGSWTFRRGKSFVLYALARKFKILNRSGYIRRNNQRIEREKLDYMETLIKLDLIAGISPVFGIRDEIRARYWPEIEELREKYGIDIRRHIHIGEDFKDPNRDRLWDPPLENQTPASWHFDSKFIKGERVELAEGELPIWHVDRPNLLGRYIDFLFEELIK